MPKRRLTNQTLGRKHVRQKKLKSISIPQMDWNTNIELKDTEESGSSDSDNCATETFENNGDQSKEDIECVDMFKEALGRIKIAGKFLFVWQFLQLVIKDQFPFTCIIFTLFCEFVQWLSLTSTMGMRYFEDSKQIWWTGKMFFGSEFIRVMEGFKHKGSIVSGDTERGFYDPLKTNVNFAVPGESVLSNYCPFSGLEQYKNGVQPGIINPIIEVYATNLKEKSHILTFDGKR